MNTLTLKSYEIDHELFRIRYVNEMMFNKMNKTHFHTGYELYYLLAGEKLFFINDELFSAKKGDMVVIHPYDLHKTSSVKGVKAERIVVNFKWSFIKQHADIEDMEEGQFQQMPNKLGISVKEQLQVERILHEMVRECEGKPQQYRAFIQSLLMMLLIIINRNKVNEGTASKGTASMTDNKMLEVASYISKNYQHNLTLKEIANQYYLSPSYLSRTFKKVTGFNVSEYIQLVRIREAQKLLRDTDLKIIEIADFVGFAQIAHFNKVFKKLTNTSPLKFRQAEKTK
ncbi:AraC family transcriptional regulator [Gracilibacillus oryzae]|uniref:AraC family transcriptional regulator n=1 Tax=Gracilibacillus oryzae TaxID=1672701 RepID=A0A7C8KR46_9BACI|nr:helix-turn-helix domain-containing protein [Gracilibacillus oryzae]KAB8129160.1 AraC family transcriptional regulator [Gracilibacillus oryzae]